MNAELMTNLINEIQRLHNRYESFAGITPEFFDPGNMEFLDKVEGSYDEEKKNGFIRFEVKGTRYDGRTELIETVHLGDPVKIVRDEKNAFNSNNFAVHTQGGKDLGNLPAELCNDIAPLYDSQILSINSACISYVEHLSKRSRNAKQAMLFVEMHFCIKEE